MQIEFQLPAISYLNRMGDFTENDRFLNTQNRARNLVKSAC